MIRLHYSNRTEQMVRALAEELSAPRDVLAPVIIVVPNRPMERWVEMRLAETLGIAANVRFLRLEHFVFEVLARAGGKRVLEPREIEGRLLAILRDECGAGVDDGLAPVRSYLLAAGDDEDAIERRCVQLAGRLTKLFQEYGYSRTQMLEAWEHGQSVLAGTALENTEAWQRAMWNNARARGRSSEEVFTLAEALRDKLDIPSGTAHVFGVSYVARVFQHALGAFSQSMALHVYALNPCAEFWEDALSDAEARRRMRRGRAPSEEDPFALEIDVDNPLLRAWGRPGREHVAMLDELTGFDAHARFEDPGDETLLTRLQSSILNRAPVAHSSSTDEDTSVMVLACSSIRREIESVAAEIWALIDRASRGPRPYRFHEIAVLVNGPDRDRYLPHLEAVFAEAHELPWNAADLALTSRSRVADCALRLFELLGSSFTRADLVFVLAHPLVISRWPDADPNRVGMLAERLGVFHGIDARDHASTYLEKSGCVHWDQAVRRLALGALMQGERSKSRAFFQWDDMMLWPEESAPSDELAQGMGLLVRSLAADARFARTAKLLPSEWARFFDAMLRAYLTVEEGAEETELRACRAAIATLEKRDAGVKMGYRIAMELARAELEALPAVRGVPLGDGVVVASLLPMRAIPFRAVFVLGMGEGRFPARELDTGLDLRAGSRKPGDVSIDERDRYTFLETLLSTRERLVLSYVARDPQTGEAREPSSILHALEEAIGEPLPRRSPPMRRHDGFTEDAIRVHALPAAVRDARARLAGAEYRPLLVETRFPEGALRRLSADDPRRALLAMPALPTPSRVPDTPRRVSIDAIWRFLECPIQGHARLAMGHDREANEVARQDEPFEVERFVRTRVLTEVFLEALDQPDRVLRSIYEHHIARCAAHGQWPMGPLAKLGEQSDELVLEAWRSVLGGEHARFERGTDVHVWRFGSNAGGGGSKSTRPHEALRIAMMSEKDESADSIEIVGATRWLLPNEEGLVLSTSDVLDGEGERARVERFKHALRVFVDHAVLSAAGLVHGSRRVWVLDPSANGPFVMQFAPMKKEAAIRWLRGVLDDVSHGPHGLFLPCDAVFRESRLFTHGSDEPSEHLARSIEHVRNKEWQGGSSRFGPVRDAIEYPAPEKAHAMAIAGRRFGAFFDHFRGARRAS